MANPTFVVEEILLGTIKSLLHKLPALKGMGRDFRTSSLKLDKEYIAHIVGVPGVSDYDEANGGYQNNATDARSLITDVPITVDQHKKVSISFNHLDSIKDDHQKYNQLMDNSGHALAQHVTLDILGKVTAANVSGVTVETTPNSNYELALNKVRDAMNLNATGGERFGIVNTPVASTLSLDDQVINSDYRGRTSEADTPYRTFRNVAGFREITEFPLLPGNSENLTGVFFESRALAILAGIPDDFDTFAARVLGAPTNYRKWVVTDPDSGLTMCAIAEVQGGTLKGYLHLTLIWGSAVGKQGGSDGDLTDYSAHRLASA